ncbi:hypothetical protein M595_3471 [Lyngbya aestuarii BL J]|uniref:Uncharacterized protein n=1 Tax=Lyngbya aestuarii BL J TaxID=1348334 RepID=U7QF67_9CYAN|nr:hypothetical protein M595_3471 [Lyngbya aestuarii BL J]
MTGLQPIIPDFPPKVQVFSVISLRINPLIFSESGNIPRRVGNNSSL